MKKTKKVSVIGHKGGSKGGSSASTPTHAADSLRSKQYATIVDVISEGEIVGLVNGLQSIYLDDTPIMGNQGQANFDGVTVVDSVGGLGVAKSFAIDATKTAKPAGVEIKNGSPIVRSVTDSNVNRVELVIGVPSLVATDKNTGSTSGTSVELKIELESNGGGYRDVFFAKSWTGTSGRNSSNYFETPPNSTGIRYSTSAGVFFGVNRDVILDHVFYRKKGDSNWISFRAANASASYGKRHSMVQVSNLPANVYEVMATSYNHIYKSSAGDGNVVGTTTNVIDYIIDHIIDYNSGANVVAEIPGSSDIISGCASSRYQRSYNVQLTGEAPWNIRITRVTADSTDQQSLQNKTFLDGLIECVDTKLTMPNTAAVSLRIDSEYFSQVPVRGYDIKGLKVKVPSNYDSETRSYDGSWDGTFKIAWTDNPAWCYYDMLTSERYGLGGFITPDQIDKFQLYTIAKYCDQLVPNGKGGQEPRFTCNLYLQTREDAYTTLSNMTSIFRSMSFWANGMLSTTQDSPKYVASQFSAANVIDGIFTYQGADLRARHTVALVSWNDPDDMFRQKVEYVQDEDLVKRWGINETEVLAVGCTSQSQAHRMGRWILYSESFESEIITFKAGLDAARCGPGDIIEVSDVARTGRRVAGRLLDGSNKSQLTLDAPVELTTGNTYEVSVAMPDGTIAKRGIVNTGVSQSVLDLTIDLPDVPVQNATFVLNSVGELVAEKWRVITVAETDPGIVEITALYHNDSKFEHIENNIVLEIPSTSVTNTRPSDVVGLSAISVLRKGAGSDYTPEIEVSWQSSKDASAYLVEYRKDDGNWNKIETSEPQVEIVNATAGTYAIRVTPFNAVGIYGSAVYVTHTVDSESTVVDQKISNLRLNSDFDGVDLPFTWDAVIGAISYTVKLYDTATNTVVRTDAVKTPGYVYTFSMNVADGGPRRSLRAEVTATTPYGTTTPASSVFENPAPAMPSGVVVTSGMRLGVFDCDPPKELDYAGTLVWLSDVSDFEVSDALVVYNGTATTFIIVKDANGNQLEGGKTYYIRAAHYDKFGRTGLHITGSLTLESLKNAPDQQTIEQGMVKDGILDVAKFAQSIEPVTVSTDATLPTAKTTETLFWNGKLYRWDGAQYTAEVSTADLSGQITSGQIAAGAIGADQIAANSLTAKHLAVGDFTNLCQNGNFLNNASGWSMDGNWAAIPAGQRGLPTAGAVIAGRDNWYGVKFNVKAGEQFYCSFIGGANTGRLLTLGLGFQDANGVYINWMGGCSSGNENTGFVSGYLTVPSGVSTARVWLQIDQASGGPQNAWATQIEVRRVSGSTLIQDGSITTDKILAGAVTTDKMVANSISGDRITAGTINGNKIVAGTISADLIQSGSNGNILPNAAMAISAWDGARNWPDLFGYPNAWQIDMNDMDYGLNLHDDWRPVGMNCLFLHQKNANRVESQGGYVEVSSGTAPVIGGQWYEASVYTGAHRCNVYAHLIFIDQTGARVSTPWLGQNNAEALGGRLLTGYKRLFVVAQAPSNAASAFVLIRKDPTKDGQSDSYGFYAMPMIAVANGPSQAYPAPWVPSDIGTQIHGSAIKTDTIRASSLSTISANLGSITGGSLNINNRFIVNNDGTTIIKSATSGARVEMSNSLIQVFDSNNVLRVRLGIW